MIEVDSMPTKEGESTPITDERIPFDRFVDGRLIISGLDSSIRVEDINNKETWILTDW